jgi:hypothetical protein
MDFPESLSLLTKQPIRPDKRRYQHSQKFTDPASRGTYILIPSLQCISAGNDVRLRVFQVVWDEKTVVQLDKLYLSQRGSGYAHLFNHILLCEGFFLTEQYRNFIINQSKTVAYLAGPSRP